MRKMIVTLATVAAVLIAGIGIAWASIPGPDGTIYGCYKNNNPNQGQLIVIDSTATCPSGYTSLNWKSVPSGTIYNAISVVGSYTHDQANPDKIVTCPDSRVVISGWAFAGNDIPLPVVINNSSSFSTYIEIHVAGSGTGPWPTTPGQIAQGESIFYGMICAQVTP